VISHEREGVEVVRGVFAALGRFSVKFRWLIVGFWIVVAIGSTALLPSLTDKAKGSDQDFLPTNAPSIRAVKLAAPFGATSVTPISVVIARSSAPLTTEDVQAISSLEAQLRTVRGVSLVSDLGRSSDGHGEQLQVLALVGNPMSTQPTDLVKSLRSKITHAGLPAGLDAHLAGDVPAQIDSQSASGTTANNLLNLVALLILVLLFVIFRSVLAPIITLLPAVLALTIASSLVAEATNSGLKVSVTSQLMLVVLVIGAGTDYGLFLVFRVREGLREGLAPKDAVAKAMTRIGESITFSAGTVIVGLLTLLAATFELYSSMAVPLAIGIGVMLLIGLTLLPALLAILGRAAFWPSRTRASSVRPGLWGQLSSRIVERPALTLVFGVVLFGLLGLASMGYKAAPFTVVATAPSGSDSAEGNALLDRYFPGATANPTFLLFRLNQPAWQAAPQLAIATQQLQQNSLFTGVAGSLDTAGGLLTPQQFAQLYAQLGPAGQVSPVPPSGGDISPSLYEAYRATAGYVSPDGLTVQFAVKLAAGDPQSTAAMNTVPALRDATKDVSRTLGAADWGVAGQAAVSYDISRTSSSDLRRVIPIAIVAIGVLLALVLRSLVAPFYLIVSVVLSYFAALGTAVLVFIRLGNSLGLTFMLPFLLFIFLLALGEDYNILVMTRIREEAQHLGLREAVAHALNATGSTVTSAGLVLAGTFALFAIVGGSGPAGSVARNIGTGIAIGILLDTFLVRTLLVPSTVVLLGRWNWWPSSLSKQDASIEPAAKQIVAT
jgi:putative drug exporter of the RND superfamily